MDQYALLNKYKAARGLLLMLLIFTVLNCFLLIMFNTTFMFSIFLPEIALLLKDGLIENGLSEGLIIIVGVFLPILLFSVCYFLSKKDWHFLLAGCVALAFDTFLMLFFWIFILDFDASIVLELMIEVICLVNIVNGVSAGAQLKNDFHEVASPEEVIRNNHINICSYDKQLAKQNKADKTIITLILLISFPIYFVAVTVAFLNEDSNYILIIALLTIGLIAVLASLAMLSPYNMAKFYGFYKDGKDIYRITFNENQLTEKLTDFKVIEQKENCYKVSYRNEYQKLKKMTIPKCYKGLEKILPKQ